MHAFLLQLPMQRPARRFQSLTDLRQQRGFGRIVAIGVQQFNDYAFDLGRKQMQALDAREFLLCLFQQKNGASAALYCAAGTSSWALEKVMRLSGASKRTGAPKHSARSDATSGGPTSSTRKKTVRVPLS